MFYLQKQAKHFYKNEILDTGKPGTYVPLLKKDEINRNTFFHLRRALISLGCPENDVIKVAQEICMELLNIENVDKYLLYILQDTYHKCKTNLEIGYDSIPIQNPGNPDYSHTNLFSSIYGYEINYLLSRGISSNIADIGCGDGLFIKLAQIFNLHIDGFEINVPEVSHPVSIQKIETFTDIMLPYSCIILNHVLEHNEIRPDLYLSSLIKHYKTGFGKEIKSILVSLPLHKDIESHHACKHYWMCVDEKGTNKDLNYDFKINTFNPEMSFKKIAQENNYKLLINKQIGLFIFES